MGRHRGRTAETVHSVEWGGHDRVYAEWDGENSEERGM